MTKALDIEREQMKDLIDGAIRKIRRVKSADITTIAFLLAALDDLNEAKQVLTK